MVYNLSLLVLQAKEQPIWSDPYSKALLENAAEAAAQYCLKYNLPRKHLTNDELKAGKEGFIGHIQVSEVFKLGDYT